MQERPRDLEKSWLQQACILRNHLQGAFTRAYPVVLEYHLYRETISVADKMLKLPDSKLSTDTDTVTDWPGLVSELGQLPNLQRLEERRKQVKAILDALADLPAK